MFRLIVRLLLAIVAIGAADFASAAAPASGIEGNWSAERTDPGAAPSDAMIAFTRNSNAIMGTMRIGGEELPLFDVRDANGTVSFTLIVPGTPYVSVRYSGTRTDTSLTLASEGDGNGVYRLTGERIGPPPAPAARAAAPAPAPPRQIAEARPQPSPAPARPAPPPPAAPQVQSSPGPGVPAYIARLLGQPAIGGAAPAATLRPQIPPPPAPQQGTRTASLPAPAARQAPPAPAAAAPAPRPAQPATPPPIPRVPGIEGEWTAEQTLPGASAPTPANLVFQRKDGALSGTLRQGDEEMPLFEVRQAGVSVSFMLVIPGTPYVSVRYVGRIAGDALELASIDEGNGIYAMSARRREAPQPVAPPPPVAEAAPPPPVTEAVPPEPVEPKVAEPAPLPAPPEPVLASLPPPPPEAIPLAEPVPQAPLPPLRGTSAPRVPRDTAGPATLNGSWSARQTSPGSAAPVEAVLSFAGNSGSMRVGTDDWPLFDVKQTDANVAFTLVIPSTPYITIKYEGALKDGELTATSTGESEGRFTIEARREESDPLPPAPAPQIASVLPPVPTPAPRPIPAAPLPETPVTAPDVAPPEPQIASLAPPPARQEPPPAPAAPLSEAPAAAPPPLPEPPPAMAQPTPEPVPTVEPEALIPALRDTTPGPEVASAVPPEPPAPPRQRYMPPPLSTAPVAKLPLPPLRDVSPSASLKLPPMGWASRQRLGTMIDEDAIRQAIEGLEESGLKAVGYTTIEVDDGWQGERDASGALKSNTEFPDMKGLGDFIHAKGLKFALTAAAAPQSCAGYTGSYGHETDDAKIFAAWGVDILIFDWCGAEKIYPAQGEMQAAVQKMAEALRGSGRDIALEIAGGEAFNVAVWGTKAGASIWRAAKDVEDKWPSVMDAGLAVAGNPAATGRGGWNNPGLLQAGNGGMTANEYRTQINLWAALGAPMMLGNDVRIMRRETVDLLTNKEVIAVSQDGLGRQGVRVGQQGNTSVWAKPLSNGAVAVLFVNRGETSAPAGVSWEQLGITGAREVRDVWWHETIGMANNRYAVFLAAHTSLLLVLSP